MKDGKRRLFSKVRNVFVWLSCFADDVDWHIEVKQQFHLVSESLKSWRGRLDEITPDRPYGREWDIMMLGHCQEVIYPPSLPAKFPETFQQV
jgi:hypothetical protein